MNEAETRLMHCLTQAVQSNMVYRPREVLMVSSNVAARLIDADR